jgi:hypothetical protein
MFEIRSEDTGRQLRVQNVIEQIEDYQHEWK